MRSLPQQQPTEDPGSKDQGEIKSASRRNSSPKEEWILQQDIRKRTGID